MKQKIFNRGRGWYIPASNYKDPQDKVYINLYFPYGQPEYVESDKGYSAIDIDIQEGKFTSYKNNPGLTIFKYELLSNIDLVKEETDSKMFGGSRDDLGDNIITDDDFPWEL